MMVPVAPLMLALIFPSAASASPSLRVSNTLGSNMVLQRGRPAPIWGWYAAGETVSVTLDGRQTHSATAGADGLWRVALPAQEASRAIAETCSGPRFPRT